MIIINIIIENNKDKMWLNNLKSGVKRGWLKSDKGYIKRWPSNPKIVFFGPPNVFMDEIT